MDTHSMIYRDALLGLMNGCLMPWDKDILSGSPLPSSVIEPYMAKEIPNVRESMRLTYETMVVWIEEAKKADYFSKRFVQLSRMIMNGVTTMGRGLITLHARGEEPDGVPMSIQDLIGVASYHFRKSHLGVLQTVRSHPEVSERLLMNQISWNNMLMRLFKTREKLNQVSGVRCQVSDAGCRPISEIGNRSEDSGSGIQDSDAGRLVSGVGRQVSDAGKALPASGEKELTLTDAGDEGFDPFKVFGPADRGLSESAAIREPGAFTAPRVFSSYDSARQTKSAKTVRGALESGSSEKKISKDEAFTAAVETPEAGDCPFMGLSPVEFPAEDQFFPAEENGKKSEEQPNSNDRGSRPDEQAAENGDSPVKGQSPGKSPNPPKYQQILQNAFERSGPSEDGGVTFMLDEILYLAADPEFGRIYPDQAAQMRSLLRQVNSS